MRPSPFQGSLRILRGSVVLNQEGHAALASEDDGELIRGQIQLVAIAQVVLAVAAAIGLIYLLKLVMVTILCSLLLAFALDPLVVLLARVRVPWVLASGVPLSFWPVRPPGQTSAPQQNRLH